MTDFLAISPFILLVILAGVVLVLDMVWHNRKDKTVGKVTVLGLVVIIAYTIFFTPPPEQSKAIFGGMLRSDWSSFVFLIVFLVGAALTSLLSLGSDDLRGRGEFFLLLLVSTLGMGLMAAASDLIMLYLAIETTSIPLFVLAGFLTRDKKSVEAGLKYLLFGAMTSSVMLYGFSLFYGFSGTTQLYSLAEKIQGGQVPLPAIFVAGALVLIGFSFKVSAFPFHFWAPDVYEGAPTPVTAFLSTASKAAGFAVLMRFTMNIYPDMASLWSLMIAIIASASMIIGNFLALAQKNIKRLLAYSSIAQAGYMLIGVASGSALGLTGTIYYLMAYLLTNLAAFGIVTIVSKTVGSDEISAYAGLSRRSPGLALAMLAALLSLGGIPPFAGFAGKLLVFAAAVEANMVWLAIIGVFNAIIALYYYLSVLKVIYLYRSEDEGKPVGLKTAWSTAIGVCVLGIVVLGTVIAPWYVFAGKAGLGLF